nr:MFS transporter [Planosporangium thailandense]
MARNRNYQLLWGSQALAEFGFNATAIAFPLLVLSVTGSPAASGLVLGAIAVAQLAAGLPAGALVDRWNRKKIMLACEATQAVAAASLVAAVVSGRVSVAHMLVVAAVIGLCAALFEPAEEATLPGIVPVEQVASAVAMNSARASLGHLSGTAVGGFLFAVGRAVPFVVDAVTHSVAFCALAFLRLPPREPRTRPAGHLGREVAEGLRWVWRHRHIRVTSLCAVALNLFFSAFYIVVIVLARARGVHAGEIGVMAAMLGLGGVVGALAAPYLHRLLTPYASIVAVFWVLAALTPLAVFARSGYVMGALFLAMALLPPTANTTITTQQLLLTPDELRGRLSSVLGLIVGVSSAVGPALGGVLVQALTPTVAVMICAGGILTVTVVVTFSATLRTFPRHATADEPAVSV